MFEEYNRNSKMANIPKTAKLGGSHNSIMKMKMRAARDFLTFCKIVVKSKMADPLYDKDLEKICWDVL